MPTNRPDVRPAPYGVDDVIEEVGRTYGYSRLPRRQPTWPEPGRLTGRQRERRLVRDVLCGVGGLEGWTPTFVADADHELIGLSGPAVRVTNPLVSDEASLRQSMLPGLLRALAYNADRRQGDLRLFEIGTVFSHPDTDGGRIVERSGAGGASRTVLPGERERLSVVLAAAGDDARMAVQAWRVLADALRLIDVRLVADESVPGLHPTRTARLVAAAAGQTVVLGAVGEVDPVVAAHFGLGRVGWLEVDLGQLATVDRRPAAARPISRFPSSDIDVALVVDDGVPVDRVADALAGAGGDGLESVVLFDVYRGDGVVAGRRSLAFRLRFGAFDRTLTDQDVGELRQRCIDAAQEAVGAVLR